MTLRLGPSSKTPLKPHKSGFLWMDLLSLFRHTGPAPDRLHRFLSSSLKLIFSHIGFLSDKNAILSMKIGNDDGP